MLTEEVDRYIQRHQLIKPNSKVMIAVSGGPDSMALLHYLLAQQERFNLDLIVVTIEHGLRGAESLRDVDYVEDFCRQYHVKFDSKRIDVKSYKKKHKLGTQEASRILRYQAFDQLMRKHHANYLALAHHADDQVETVFMRLTRGTQLDTLQGIKNKRRFSIGQLIRPFLSITKEAIENYCQQHGIIPRHDQSNDEDAYTRNYFRIHVLPLLKVKNPNLSETVMHLTENIAADRHYLMTEAKKLSEELLNYSNHPKKVTVRINALKKRPLALQRRLFHLILEYLYEEFPDHLSYRHETQFFDLVNSDRANASIDLPFRLKMIKSYQLLTFYFAEKETLSYHVSLAIPGRTVLPNKAEVITEFVEQVEASTANDSIFYLPVKNNHYPNLVIRSRLPGDRIHLAHINGRKKVSRIFIDKKVPLEKRDQWPILVGAEDEILWVVGLEKNDNPEQKMTQYIKITYQLS
ncbi:tRNA lysidine(34) synthetase TilS [Amphibacillus indicireducens]|uniref:tRNA(Ile)-lysidine synthase n=1 Tax=Amphibacillus indicireducens TaxID=1076330 RepID=A0ABP7VXQ0_9BACI